MISVQEGQSVSHGYLFLTSHGHFSEVELIEVHPRFHIISTNNRRKIEHAKKNPKTIDFAKLAHSWATATWTITMSQHDLRSIHFVTTTATLQLQGSVWFTENSQSQKIYIYI